MPSTRPAITGHTGQIYTEFQAKLTNPNSPGDRFSISTVGTNHSESSTSQPQTRKHPLLNNGWVVVEGPKIVRNLN